MSSSAISSHVRIVVTVNRSCWGALSVSRLLLIIERTEQLLASTSLVHDATITRYRRQADLDLERDEEINHVRTESKK